MNDRRLRFDLFIAVCALLISSIAAGASAYQTYVIRQQFSATVWPYLSATTTLGGDGQYIEIDLRNDGVGPALIRSAVITRDGRAVMVPSGSTDNTLAVALAPELSSARRDEARLRTHEVIKLETTSINPGSVLPAGTHWQLLRAESPSLTRRLVVDAKRIDLTVCYCSLLGQCWMMDFQSPLAQPQNVRACPLPVS